MDATFILLAARFSVGSTDNNYTQPRCAGETAATHLYTVLWFLVDGSADAGFSIVAVNARVRLLASGTKEYFYY